jgi:hypothetical protein
MAGMKLIALDLAKIERAINLMRAKDDGSLNITRGFWGINCFL